MGGDPSRPRGLHGSGRTCWTRSARDPDPVLGRSAWPSPWTATSLAGRVVLQTMLGKVVRLAQAHPDVAVDDFVSALWCRIRTYPLTRRPRRIAANLALDTRKDALGRLAHPPVRDECRILVGVRPGSSVLHRRADSEVLDHNGPRPAGTPAG